jgi:hypothetical protein
VCNKIEFSNVGDSWTAPFACVASTARLKYNINQTAASLSTIGHSKARVEPFLDSFLQSVQNQSVFL